MPAEQITGIIKTMPVQFLKDFGARQLIREFVDQPNVSDRFQFVWYFRSRPKHEVLHFYLLLGGRIRWRANIIEIRKPITGFLYKETPRAMDADWWVVTGAPVIRAPHKIEMKGFQGFRYTGDLWQ